MYSNVAFDRTDNPGKGPRGSGKTKRKELKYKDSETSSIPNDKGKILVMRPVQVNSEKHW